MCDCVKPTSEPLCQRLGGGQLYKVGGVENGPLTEKLLPTPLHILSNIWISCLQNMLITSAIFVVELCTFCERESVF